MQNKTIIRKPWLHFLTLLLLFSGGSYLVLAKKIVVDGGKVVVPDPRKLLPDEVVLTGRFIDKETKEPVKDFSFEMKVGETKVIETSTQSDGSFEASFLVKNVFKWQTFKDLCDGKISFDFKFLGETAFSYQHNKPIFDCSVDGLKKGGGLRGSIDPQQWKKGDRGRWGYPAAQEILVASSELPQMLLAQSKGNYVTGNTNTKSIWRSMLGDLLINANKRLPQPIEINFTAVEKSSAGTYIKLNKWMLCLQNLSLQKTELEGREAYSGNTNCTPWGDSFQIRAFLSSFKPENKDRNEFGQELKKYQNSADDFYKNNFDLFKCKTNLSNCIANNLNLHLLAIHSNINFAPHEFQFIPDHNNPPKEFRQGIYGEKIPVFEYNIIFEVRLNELFKKMGFVNLTTKTAEKTSKEDQELFAKENICLTFLKDNKDENYGRVVFYKSGSFFIPLPGTGAQFANNHSFLAPGNYSVKDFVGKVGSYSCMKSDNFLPSKNYPEIKINLGSKTSTEDFIYIAQKSASVVTDISYEGEIPAERRKLDHMKIVSLANKGIIKLVNQANLNNYQVEGNKLRILINGQESKIGEEKFIATTTDGLISEFTIKAKQNDNGKLEFSADSPIEVKRDQSGITLIPEVIDGSSYQDLKVNYIRIVKEAVRGPGNLWYNMPIDGNKFSNIGFSYKLGVTGTRNGFTYQGYSEEIKIQSVYDNHGSELKVPLKFIGGDSKISLPLITPLAAEGITEVKSEEKFFDFAAKEDTNFEFTATEGPQLYCGPATLSRADLLQSGNKLSSLSKEISFGKKDFFLIDNGCISNNANLGDSMWDQKIQVLYIRAVQGKENILMEQGSFNTVDQKTEINYTCTLKECKVTAGPANTNYYAISNIEKEKVQQHFDAQTKKLLFVNYVTAFTNNVLKIGADKEVAQIDSSNYLTKVVPEYYLASKNDPPNIMVFKKEVPYTTSITLGGKLTFVKGARLPMDIGKDEITSEFFRAPDSKGNVADHFGMDIDWRTKTGPEVFSLCNAEVFLEPVNNCVTNSGCYYPEQCSKPDPVKDPGCGKGFGNQVWLKCSQGNWPKPVYILYAHLEQNSMKIKAGDKIRVGQYLAKGDHTGRSTDPHLHIGTYLGGISYSEAIPLNCLNWDAEKIEGTDSADGCYNYTKDWQNRKEKIKKE